MTKGSRLTLGAIAPLLALAAACAHQTPPAAATAPIPPPAAAELPRPEAIPGEFTVRQKLVAKSAHGGGSFEAVLQKKGGTLTMIGLTPYGGRAFVLQQTGGDVQFTKYIPQELPFAPTFILLDVHRVWDAWLGAPLATGDRLGVVAGEKISERWRDGRLVERRFVRAEAGQPGEIVVSYGAPGPGGLAAHVTLENGRFGYRLDVDTLPSL
jgi:hypothetical protein